MIRGREFHSIVNSVFDGDVKGLSESEQIQVNCPRCQQREGLNHPDGRYNLEINTAKRIFRCWKCDEPKFSGSLGKLVRLYGSRVDYDLYKSYAGSISSFELGDIEFEEEEIFVELPEEFIPFSEMNSNDPIHMEAYKYMVLDRKVSYETLNKYRIGFCTRGKYANRIIIPSYNQDGDLTYFVGRAFRKGMKPPYLNPKANKDAIIFNEGMINWDSTIYMVEGVFEMLSFPINTIPILGKNMPMAFFNKIKEIKPNIVIVLDPDALKNTIEIYQKLVIIYGEQSDRVKFVKLDGSKDLDEIKRSEGNLGVIKRIKTLRSIESDDYFTFKKYNNEYGGKRRYFNSSRENNQW
jgi:hypothetical protein